MTPSVQLDNAQQAVKKLQLAGFAEDEVIAVAGQDFIELAKEEIGRIAFPPESVFTFAFVPGIVFAFPPRSRSTPSPL